METMEARAHALALRYLKVGYVVNKSLHEAAAPPFCIARYSLARHSAPHAASAVPYSCEIIHKMSQRK